MRIILLFGFYMIVLAGFPGGRWIPLKGAGYSPWISAHPIIGRVAGVFFVLTFIFEYIEVPALFWVSLGLVLMVTGMIVAAGSRR
jgi:hypothetical protein